MGLLGQIAAGPVAHPAPRTASGHVLSGGGSSQHARNPSPTSRDAKPAGSAASIKYGARPVQRLAHALASRQGAAREGGLLASLGSLQNNPYYAANQAANAAMVRAEDGSLVPPSFYRGSRAAASPLTRLGALRKMVPAEDGSLVPPSFYGSEATREGAFGGVAGAKGSGYQRLASRMGREGGVGSTSNQFGFPKGMLQPGTSDPYHAPGDVQLHGGYGTLEVPLHGPWTGTKGPFVVIPQIDRQGQIMSDDQALTHWHTTGEHFGVFDSGDSAGAYAQSLNSFYGPPAPRRFTPGGPSNNEAQYLPPPRQSLRGFSRQRPGRRPVGRIPRGPDLWLVGSGVQRPGRQ